MLYLASRAFNEVSQQVFALAYNIDAAVRGLKPSSTAAPPLACPQPATPVSDSQPLEGWCHWVLASAVCSVHMAQVTIRKYLGQHCPVPAPPTRGALCTHLGDSGFSAG